ncbi:MAG TPA: hypothetical protein VIE43_03105 [Thermoanaerobaculia bacterium]|jgi:hypothetical protein|nr:hypothetical protein [Thermoanaerobaculia bacterium]
MSDSQLSDVKSVEKTMPYSWSVELFEKQGRCWLSWSTTAPFRAQQGRVCLYANSFPSDPTKAVAWTWDSGDHPNPFDTKQTWGSGWCAAYIAEKSPNGPYVYLLKTPVTTES